jgi:hypothetical protein
MKVIGVVADVPYPFGLEPYQPLFEQVRRNGRVVWQRPVFGLKLKQGFGQTLSAGWKQGRCVWSDRFSVNHPVASLLFGFVEGSVGG